MSAHDAGQTVAVGDGEGRITKLDRAGCQFIGMRSPFQELEIRLAAEFRVAIDMLEGDPGA